MKKWAFFCAPNAFCSFINLELCENEKKNLLLNSFQALLNALIRQMIVMEFKENCIYFFYCNVKLRRIQVLRFFDYHEFALKNPTLIVVFNCTVVISSCFKGFAICV